MKKKNIKVLLIGGHPNDANSIIELLKQAEINNHQVIYVERLQNSRIAVIEQNFDIILLDLSQDNGHGIENLLNTVEIAPNIPIIALDDDKSEEMAIQSIISGAQDFLIKDKLDCENLSRSILYSIERKKAEHILKKLQRKLINSEAKLIVYKDKLEQKAFERTYDLGERIKELSCLYDISKIVEQPNISIEKILRKVVKRIPSSTQYPEIACSRILYNSQEFKTKNFIETKWGLSTKITVYSEKRITVEISYQIDKQNINVKASLIKKKDLIDTIAEILGRAIEHKIKEQEIRESEQKLNFILSNIDDMVIIISKDFKIQYMNKKAEKEFGEHQIGNICYNILNKRDKECESCPFDILPTNSDAENIFETSYSDPITENKRYYEFTSTPILYFKGQPALIDIIRDISDRKKAENILKYSEEKFRSLVENIPYSIMLLDSNQKLYDCNTASELYLNKTKEELVGKKIF